MISAKVLDKPTVYGGGDVLLPSVQHSGSYYVANVICEGKPSHLRRNGEIARKKTHVIHGHYDVRHEVFKELSRRIKTVIPVRHPALIAVSWKKRGPAQWRTDNFLTQWNRMHEIDGFLFPIEQKPFDELEDYLGAKVNRLDRVIHSIGEYNEKRSLETARDFLGSEWALVKKALQTPIGRKFYVDSICGV